MTEGLMMQHASSEFEGDGRTASVVYQPREPNIAASRQDEKSNAASDSDTIVVRSNGCPREVGCA